MSIPVRFLDSMLMLTPFLFASNANLMMFAMPPVQVSPAMDEVAMEFAVVPEAGVVARVDELLTACS